MYDEARGIHQVPRLTHTRVRKCIFQYITISVSPYVKCKLSYTYAAYAYTSVSLSLQLPRTLSLAGAAVALLVRQQLLPSALLPTAT